MRDDASRRPVQGHHPVFGLEALDRMGIDIDQDPCAVAQFLELRKLAGRHRPPGGRRGRPTLCTENCSRPER